MDLVLWDAEACVVAATTAALSAASPGAGVMLQLCQYLAVGFDGVLCSLEQSSKVAQGAHGLM